MLFNTIEFLFFMPILFLAYYIVPKRFQWIILLFFSIVFYLFSVPVFILYVLGTIVTTYFGALFLGFTVKPAKRNLEEASNNVVFDDIPRVNHRKRKVIIFSVIVINVGILFITKYLSFSISLLNSLMNRLHFNHTLPVFSIVQPLGISFYTLQALGYIIDVYRNKYIPEKNLAKHALYILYFPQIVQGPIGRCDLLSAQLFRGNHFDYTQVKFGLQLVLWGFFKKLVIADRCGILVNEVFTNYQNYSGYQILIASLFYTVQIYADFSGFTDIAIGVSQSLGIKLSDNFKQPYFSRSIQDFWRRWHISLSSWFRDYIYFPLGGNRKGELRKYLNVILVFVISGLWHGVGFNYIAWGLLHGSYQVVGALTKNFKGKLARCLGLDMQSRVYHALQVAINLFLINLSWIFFRAEGFRKAIFMIESMVLGIIQQKSVGGLFYSLGLNEIEFLILTIAIILAFFVSLQQRRKSIRVVLSQQPLIARWPIYILALASVVLLGLYGPASPASPFIYYNF